MSSLLVYPCQSSTASLGTLLTFQLMVTAGDQLTVVVVAVVVAVVAVVVAVAVCVVVAVAGDH